MDNATLNEANNIRDEIRRQGSLLRDIKLVKEGAERQPDEISVSEFIDFTYTLSLARIGKRNFISIMEQVQRLHEEKLCAAEEAFRDL